MAIHQPQTVPILPMAGIGRGYHLHKGSQIGQYHKGVLLITTAYRGHPQGSTGSFCEDDGMKLAGSAFHHSCPDTFSCFVVSLVRLVGGRTVRIQEKSHQSGLWPRDGWCHEMKRDGEMWKDSAKEEERQS